MACSGEPDVRRCELVRVWRRFREHFRGPAASNPKLISYLAAGSVKGLSPLRYERRVTRNRLVALTLILSFIIWAIVAASIRH
jgi:hypothetical protein